MLSYGGTQVQPFLNRILHGDCREVLAQLSDACVDWEKIVQFNSGIEGSR
jgi:hypothetical protein